MDLATDVISKEVLDIAPEHIAIIDGVLADNSGRPGATMVVLTTVQERIGFISPPMQAYIAGKLGVPLSHLYGVLTFYSFFRMSPVGKHTVSICLGTACYVRGASTLEEKFMQVLGVKMGETTEDNLYTLEVCRCVGACSQAPVVMIDDDIVGRVKPQDVAKVLRKYQ